DLTIVRLRVQIRIRSFRIWPPQNWRATTPREAAVPASTTSAPMKPAWRPESSSRFTNPMMAATTMTVSARVTTARSFRSHVRPLVQKLRDLFDLVLNVLLTLGDDLVRLTEEPRDILNVEVEGHRPATRRTQLHKDPVRVG